MTPGTDADASGHGCSIHPMPADVRLLVRLVRGDRRGIERCLRCGDTELDRVADLCSRAGLSTTLLHALAGSPVRLVLSPRRRTLLEGQRKWHEARQQVLRQTLISLSERFSDAGQSFILLKGPYLAARFYGSVLARGFTDLDLLVPRADRRGACEILAGAGFQRRSRTLLGPALASRFVHAFDFTRGEACVDLHWCLSRHPSLHTDEARLWARRASYALEGQPYDVLSEEDEVIFAALSLLRDLERGRAKTKNVLDTVQIVADVDPKLDWEAILEGGAFDGTRGPLVNVLGLCLELAEAHDLAPRLASALVRHGARRVHAKTAGAPTLFWPAPYGLGNKLWAARVYDGSLAATASWWALSLPFRVAVHRWR